MVEWVKRHPLIYVAVTVPGLLLAWEFFARQFTSPEPTPPPLATLTLPLYEVDRESPAPLSPQPRLLILGNSQVHYVRDQEDIATYGFPAQLQADLACRGQPVEMADLSAGGQQVVESLAILIDAFDRVRPDQVLLGLGLANMRSTTIPPQLINSLDWERVRTGTQPSCDMETSPELASALLQLYTPPIQVGAAHEPTIQEQFDEHIAEWLTEHSAAVKQRSVMSEWVTKLPSQVEREIRVAWKKKARGQLKARTYEAGPNYELSLAAVRIMAVFCREKQVPFTVIAMPFHPSCQPILYVPEDEQRLTVDLQRLDENGSLRRLDLRHLLGPEHYGTFQDGSPDGLHFLATGHALLGKEVASQLSSSPRLRFADAKERGQPENHRTQ